MNRPSKNALILLGVFVGVLALSLIMGVIYNDAKRGATEAKSVIAKQKAPVKYLHMLAEELAFEYRENEVKADNEYRDKTFIIWGPIVDIGKDFLDRPFVVLGDLEFTNVVKCSFGSKFNLSIGELAKGEKIEILGVVRGKAGYVQMTGIELHPVDDYGKPQ
jgi:hypothetical protein